MKVERSWLLILVSYRQRIFVYSPLKCTYKIVLSWNLHIMWVRELFNVLFNAKIELREAQTPNLSEWKKSKTTQLRRICFAIIFVSLFSSQISRHNCCNGLCPKNIVQEAPSLKTSQIRKEWIKSGSNVDIFPKCVFQKGRRRESLPHKKWNLWCNSKMFSFFKLKLQRKNQIYPF